jgi:hypothetical protein
MLSFMHEMRKTKKTKNEGKKVEKKREDERWMREEKREFIDFFFASHWPMSYHGLISANQNWPLDRQLIVATSLTTGQSTT